MPRAYVVGSGPNGLTAAIYLARAGVEVTVLEAQPTIGGGTRSAELTLPGFVHDVCSAVHPMAAGSPAFAALPLAEHGLRWLQPDAPLAHPLDDGTAALLERSVEATAAGLGADGFAYHQAVSELSRRWGDIAEDALAPPHLPRHPVTLARLGWLAGWPASWSARMLFRGVKARALLAGLAGHSVLPLDMVGSGAIGWMLGLAGHAVGWPIPAGGSQKIADALASYLRSLGGKIEVGRPVRSLRELEGADALLCDVAPRQLAALAGDRLPPGYRRLLEDFRYGPGVFKVDWALAAPIPWKAPECARAGTVHIGGTFAEIAASERAAWDGRLSERPYVLLAQPSLFDPSRAPEGRHTAWAYCHVPNGCDVDRTAAIEAQIERFAPGFRDRILARHVMSPSRLEERNANLVGGDITGGAQSLGQLFLRPTRRLYRTPVRSLYLCSSSTPPGAGVHGLCGYYAAQAALADLKR